MARASQALMGECRDPCGLTGKHHRVRGEENEKGTLGLWRKSKGRGRDGGAGVRERREQRDRAMVYQGQEEVSGVRAGIEGLV